VNRNFYPTRPGWTIVLIAAAALALAGCGRKGGLDLPPTAANASTESAPPADTQTEAASRPGLFNSTSSADAAPSAAKGKKKPFVLDPLLGN